MIFLQLFLTFLKIGLFGFGGGYAMLSMIQGEVVVRHAWLTASEFTDIVAISQVTPGPVGINSATYVGYSAVVQAGYSPAYGILGSALATLAVTLPSFVLMIGVSRLLLKHRESLTVGSIFRGLRPVVVGLLASAALLLMTPGNFGSPQDDLRQFAISSVIFVAVFWFTQFRHVHPILMIVLCGIAGAILYA